MPESDAAGQASRHLMHRKLHDAARRVAAVFLLLSIGWILVSDVLLHQLVGPGPSEFLLGMIKECVYVAVIAVVLYALIMRETSRRLRSEEELLNSQTRLDLAVDSTQGGEWQWDMATGRVFISPRLARLIGIETAPDHIREWHSRVHPDDLATLDQSTNRVLDGVSDVHEAEFRIRHADGSYRWLITRGQAQRDDQGRLVGMTGLDFDITDRKAAEQALAESEQLFRAVFQQSAIGMVIMSPDGRAVRANAKLGAFLGYSTEELVGKSFLEVTYSADVPLAGESFGNALTRPDGTYALEKRYIRKDGRVVWGYVSAVLLRDDDGQPRQFVAVVEDIDERKRFEESLLKANRSLSLLSRCNEVLIRATAEQELLDSLCRMLIDGGGYRFAWIALDDGNGGLKRMALAGTDGRRIDGGLINNGLADADLGPTTEALQSGQPLVVHGNGNGRRTLIAGSEIKASAFLPLLSDARPLGVFSVHSGEKDAFNEDEIALLNELSRDLAFGLSTLRERTRRLAAEQAAGETARQLRLLMESTAEAIFGVDAGGRITFCNRTALTMLNRSDSAALIGASFHQTLHARFRGQTPEERNCPLCMAIREGRATAGDDMQLNIEYQDIYIEYFSRPIYHRGKLEGAVIAMLDVSRRRAAEEQMRHAQRMEALGQLTGGVAHDFNNLLAIIVGNLELLEERLSSDPDRVALARQAIRAADRGADLTRHLLAFSRKQPLMPQIIDLNEHLQDVTNMLQRTLGEAVEIELVRSPSLWKCEIDPTQFDNVLVNLALNARDAMRSRGKLTIETANSRLDEDYAAANGDVTPGQYVMLAVTDNGAGMPLEVAERAFEPFFTTKKVGEGSGLGLSMVYGFVKQSGGHIKLYSESGQGTTVRVYLPRTRLPIPDAAAGEQRSTEQPVIGVRVLVVEDDAEVCASTVALLEDAGCVAVATPDAEAALALIDQGETFDLLFTDVVLPGPMNGSELAWAVRAKQPGLRFLFTSGYTENAIVHHGRLDDGVEFIAKPYRKAELIRRLRKLLSSHDD